MSSPPHTKETLCLFCKFSSPVNPSQNLCIKILTISLVSSTPDGKMVGEHHDISFSYKNDHPYVTAYYRPELIRPMERHIV